jgi:NAD-dependent deacetylase
MIDPMTQQQVEGAARAIVTARYAIALTGAGLSVDSGIPPFRGPGGLWTRHGEPPMNAFQIFMADPKRGWEERLRRRGDDLYRGLRAAEPNAGHRALVAMEQLGVLRFVITQNIDNLHRRAGQRALAEIHGNYQLVRCLSCNGRFEEANIDLNILPPDCPECGGLLKGDTVSFGEPIPADVLSRCAEEAEQADLVLLAGTSATVYPAAGFALQVKRQGGVLIEANLYRSEISDQCDFALRGSTAQTLPALVERLAALRRAALS